MAKKNGYDFATVKIGTIIGSGAVIKGNYSSQESARIEGEINGDLVSEAAIIVEEKGRIVGNIHADSVMIAGNVKGNIVAKSKVELLSTGKIYGDITTKSLIIDEKAVFIGKCNMDPEHDEDLD